MSHISLLAVLLLFSSALTFAHESRSTRRQPRHGRSERARKSESRWPRYVRKADRAGIVSKTHQLSDGLMTARPTIISIDWITESRARADVSDVIDKLRWKSIQAEKEYRRLRGGTNDVYTFRISVGLLGEHILLGRMALKDQHKIDPLEKTTLLMRRGDEVLKGTVTYRNYTHTSRKDMGDVFLYEVIFPRHNQGGRRVVNDLNDSISIEFEVIHRKVDFSFQVNDMVTSLEDL